MRLPVGRSSRGYAAQRHIHAEIGGILFRRRDDSEAILYRNGVDLFFAVSFNPPSAIRSPQLYPTGPAPPPPGGGGGRHGICGVGRPRGEECRCPAGRKKAALGEPEGETNSAIPSPFYTMQTNDSHIPSAAKRRWVTITGNRENCFESKVQ